MTTESMKPYPAYKDSGIEWIGEIPEGWEIKKLKWLADIKLNNIDKKSKEDELTVKLCNYVDVYYNDNITPNIKFMVATASKNQINALSLEKGDILITKDSELPDDIAVPAFVPESLSGIVCGYHLARIRPNENAYGNYLFRSFLSNGIRDQFEMNANGITRFGIGKYTIENSLFLVPPFPEQQSIATFLGNQTAKIDTLIENKQKQIELLKEERTAIINQAVTKGLNPDVPMRDSGIEWLGEIPEHWGITKLKFILNKIGSGLTPRGGAEVYQDYGVPLLRSQNVHFDGLRLDDVAYISNETHKSMNRSAVKPDDVLINITGASIGRCAIVPTDFSDGNVNQHVCILRTSEKISSKYLHLLLSSQIGQLQVFNSQNGAAREGLNFEQLGDFFVTLPLLNEQNELTRSISINIDEIMVLISQIQQQIILLQEYRTALISEAVTGKIDLRNQHEIPASE